MDIDSEQIEKRTHELGDPFRFPPFPVERG